MNQPPYISAHALHPAGQATLAEAETKRLAACPPQSLLIEWTLLACRTRKRGVQQALRRPEHGLSRQYCLLPCATRGALLLLGRTNSRFLKPCEVIARAPPCRRQVPSAAALGTSRPYLAHRLPMLLCHRAIQQTNLEASCEGMRTWRASAASQAVHCALDCEYFTADPRLPRLPHAQVPLAASSAARV